MTAAQPVQSTSTGFEVIGGDVLFASEATGGAGARRHRLTDGQPVATWGTDGLATLNPRRGRCDLGSGAVHPAGGATARRPSAVANYSAGAFIANGVTATLDANGDVCIFTLAAADILIDVNGYLTGVTDD